MTSSAIPFRSVAAALAAVTLLAAVPARADRGALSLDAGAGLVVASLNPPVGSGPAQSGVLYEGRLGLRYAVSNLLEVYLGGYYDMQAPWSYSGDVVPVAGSAPLTGTLQSQMAGWGAEGGARRCAGPALRLCLTAGRGAAMRLSSRMDLLNPNAAGGPASYGAGVVPGSITSFGPMAEVGAGFEWLVTDHQTVALTPLVRAVGGTGGGVYLVLPVTWSYSWYGF